MSQSSATIHLKTQFANKPDFSVDNGEDFKTIAKDKTTGILLLFDPDRDDQAFVGLAGDQVEDISSSRMSENRLFKVWGEKEAWEGTPSPIYNI